MRPVAALLSLASWLLIATAALAQPEEPWVRERIGLLVLEGPATTTPAVRALASEARQIVPRVESDLGVRPARSFRMLLVPRGGFRDTTLARLDEMAPPWAAGYMLPERRIGAIRIGLSAQYPYGTLESVLAHEAVHLLLHDAVGRRLPLWFEEGVATWQGRRWSATDLWIVTRSLMTADLPALADLDASFRASADEAEMAYAASFAFVSWSVRRHGDDLVRTVLRETRTRPFPEAWEAATGAPLADAEEAWRRETVLRYRWLPALTASSTLWAGIALLAVLAGARKRARAREARERWALEETEAEVDPSSREDNPGPQ